MHTSFAWLGYGSIIHRSLATAFLHLLDADHLHVTADELKMADNYFSILRNEVPEAWFDQGIELGGGQAFTVGSAGEERNRKHIVSGEAPWMIAWESLTIIALGMADTAASGRVPRLACAVRQTPLSAIGRQAPRLSVCVLRERRAKLPRHGRSHAVCRSTVCPRDHNISPVGDSHSLCRLGLRHPLS